MDYVSLPEGITSSETQNGEDDVFFVFFHRRDTLLGGSPHLESDQLTGLQAIYS